jgi:hypothetical protein
MDVFFGVLAVVRVAVEIILGLTVWAAGLAAWVVGGAGIAFAVGLPLWTGPVLPAVLVGSAAGVLHLRRDDE